MRLVGVRVKARRARWDALADADVFACVARAVRDPSASYRRSHSARCRRWESALEDRRLVPREVRGPSRRRGEWAGTEFPPTRRAACSGERCGRGGREQVLDLLDRSRARLDGGVDHRADDPSEVFGDVDEGFELELELFGRDRDDLDPGEDRDERDPQRVDV